MPRSAHCGFLTNTILIVQICPFREQLHLFRLIRVRFPQSELIREFFYSGIWTYKPNLDLRLDQIRLQSNLETTSRRPKWLQNLLALSHHEC